MIVGWARSTAISANPQWREPRGYIVGTQATPASGASSARTKNDRDRAFWLAAELKQLGHTPHIHGWELKGGDDIRNKWQRNSKL